MYCGYSIHQRVFACVAITFILYILVSCYLGENKLLTYLSHFLSRSSPNQRFAFLYFALCLFSQFVAFHNSYSNEHRGPHTWNTYRVSSRGCTRGNYFPFDL